MEALVRLEGLDATNNYIREIKGLDTLPNIRDLNLSNNPITNIKELSHLVYLSKLERITLYGVNENDLKIPRELFGSGEYDNCLEQLQLYLKPRKTRELAHNVKLIK